MYILQRMYHHRLPLHMHLGSLRDVFILYAGGGILENLVIDSLEGFNGSLFAYGQTGCGKTHTMMGPTAALEPGSPLENERGIIPRAVRHIFGFIDAADKNIKFLVRCSYLEIYNENILDLLCTKKE